MDHFDLPTLKCLPSTTRAVTAQSTADLFKTTRLHKITELGWGDKSRVHTRHGDVDIQAFEVNHWGARWRGDTAWTTNFRHLRGRQPIVLAIMPIGAYKPWLCSHCTPEQAVRMANDAG